MKLYVFLVAYAVCNLKADAFPSLTASMASGDYRRNRGGGSSLDTPWIDLMSIVEIASMDAELSELAKLMDATELGFKLEQSRHTTFFMPNNHAIQSELKGALPYLSYPELMSIFQDHIIAEVIKVSEIQNDTQLRIKTIADTDLIIEPFLKYNLVRVFTPDMYPSEPAIIQGKEIQSANGIVYIINRLLLTNTTKEILKKSINSATVSFNITNTVPRSPDYIDETNAKHWLYGRFGHSAFAAPKSMLRSQQPTLTQDSLSLSFVGKTNYPENSSRSGILT